MNPTWVRTPLIERLIPRRDFTDSMIEPMLEPEDVVTAVVDQVLSGRSGHLILPAPLNLLSTIRGWPSWLQAGLRNVNAQYLAGV